MGPVKLIRTAGGIVWRVEQGTSRVAIVHRPGRGDWSLPKGRLAAGECWQDGARREIVEETGCEVRLGRFAGGKLHLDRPQPKLTLYWHARLVREGELRSDEVDEVAWLTRREALQRLDHASDRRLVLRTLGRAREPWRVDRGPAVRATLAALRGLVISDSRKAEEALPAVLGLVSGALGAGARLARARRA